MKRLIIIFLFLLSQLSFSQTKDAFELCYAFQQNFNQFDSNFEANDVLERILYVTGATPNFVLMECDKISNAIAVTYKGERYILYDKEFMSLISNNTNSWSNTFILAHEVGHHINGHTKDIALGTTLSEQELEEQRKEELEADYYAGFVLAKLGASLSQTNAAVNLISSDSDDRYSTHPDRNKRIEAIRRGWNNGLEGDISQGRTNSTSSKDLKSSSWVQYKSVKKTPFDDQEIYAYTIGKTLPVDAGFNNLKPKFMVYDEPKSSLDFIKITGLNFNLKDPKLEVSIIEIIECKPYKYGTKRVIREWDEEKKRYIFDDKDVSGELSCQWIYRPNDKSPFPNPEYRDDFPEGITSLKQYFSSQPIGKVIDADIDFRKMAKDIVNSSKETTINEILDYMRKLVSNLEKPRLLGNRLDFEVVFDSGDENFIFYTDFFIKRDFFNPSKVYDLNLNLYRPNILWESNWNSSIPGFNEKRIVELEKFIRLMKEKNKMFVRLIRAENTLYARKTFEYRLPSNEIISSPSKEFNDWDGLIRHDDTPLARRFFINYSVKLKTDLKPLEEKGLLNGDAYFEFRLKGSTKALSFD